jgi:hypothetical protein
MNQASTWATLVLEELEIGAVAETRETDWEGAQLSEINRSDRRSFDRPDTELQAELPKIQ